MNRIASNNLIACDQFEVVQQHICCSRTVVCHHYGYEWQKLMNRKKKFISANWVSLAHHPQSFEHDVAFFVFSDCFTVEFSFCFWCFCFQPWCGFGFEMTQTNETSNQMQPSKISPKNVRRMWALVSLYIKFVLFYGICRISNCNWWLLSNLIWHFLLYFFSLMSLQHDKNDISITICSKRPLYFDGVTMQWHSSNREINNDADK